MNHTTRQRILVALKKQGHLTTRQLATMLGITPMGVRRHLTLLQHDRLVESSTIRQGLGRPSQAYRLTSEAQALFPTTYAQLTNELLGYVESFDGSAQIEALFQQRAQRRIQQARGRLQSLDSLAARVAELAAILDEDGYLAEWEQLDDNTFALREFNCAVHSVASRFRQACGSELTFIQAVLPEADIVRQHHLLGDDIYCGYRITRRPHSSNEQSA
jgi:predicted ArsR family transcriptional regulator